MHLKKFPGRTFIAFIDLAHHHEFENTPINNPAVLCMRAQLHRRGHSIMAASSSATDAWSKVETLILEVHEEIVGADRIRAALTTLQKRHGFRLDAMHGDVAVLSAGSRA